MYREFENDYDSLILTESLNIWMGLYQIYIPLKAINSFTFVQNIFCSVIFKITSAAGNCNLQHVVLSFYDRENLFDFSA